MRRVKRKRISIYFKINKIQGEHTQQSLDAVYKNKTFFKLIIFFKNNLRYLTLEFCTCSLKKKLILLRKCVVKNLTKLIFFE